MKKKINTILDEETRVDLKVNNIWAIAVSVIVSAFIFGVFYAKMQTTLDMVLANQIEMKNDFKSWRTQYEDRLGKTQSNQNSVISFLKREFGFQLGTN